MSARAMCAVLLWLIPVSSLLSQDEIPLEPVIVSLNVPFTPEGELGVLGVAAQRAAISNAQTLILSAISNLPHAVARRYETVPAMAISISAAARDVLNLLPLVLHIQEDGSSRPDASDSVPLIGAAASHNIGYDGNGQVIAIIDTGVDRHHSHLQGKVVSEACYSASGSNSFCPSGASTSTAADSALPCPVAHSSFCIHGTHVAGVAAANGPQMRGTAPGARIIAVQVYRRCGTNCLEAKDSDVIAGLERVYQLRNTFTIAAANLSLGNGNFGDCYPIFGDSGYRVIDNLNSVGIAVTASSGNKGSTTGIHKPACFTNAIAVGNSTKQDAVYTDPPSGTFASNSGSALDLLAPGSGNSTIAGACPVFSGICSTLPGSIFDRRTGTSLSAPHVAGAIALIRQISPSASVGTIRGLLSDSGRQILDTRNGISRPRVQVDMAMSITGDMRMINGACYGDYTVTWTTSLLSPYRYELEKSIYADFRTTELIYAGLATSFNVNITRDTYFRVVADRRDGAKLGSAQWSQCVIAVMEPREDRRIGATPGSA